MAMLIYDRKITKAQTFYCEIYKSPDVGRIGEWDYCPKGHAYVSKRVEGNEQ